MFLAHFGFVLDYIKTEEAAFNVFVGINVLCWIGQFVGHGIFEGRKPALFDNILQGNILLFFALPNCPIS